MRTALEPSMEAKDKKIYGMQASTATASWCLLCGAVGACLIALIWITTVHYS